MKKIKIAVMMLIPKDDFLDIEKIGEDIHSALDEYGQIYGTSYDFDHEENLRASIDKSKRILELTTQLAEAKADYEAAVEDIGKYARNIHTCQKRFEDCDPRDHEACWECKNWTYRGRQGK